MNTLMSARALSAQDAEHMLLQMVPGQTMIYHTGLLPVDRSEGKNFMQVEGVARVMLNASERREVHLVQRKIKEFVYEYLAIKSDRRAQVVLDRQNRRDKSAGRAQGATASVLVEGAKG